MSKYGAKPVVVCAACDAWHDGALSWSGKCRACGNPTRIRFASKAEAARYGHLKTLERAGQIRGLQLQPKFPVIINGKLVFTYFGDFAYEQDGRQITEDVKGRDTPTSRLKRKTVEAAYPGIKIELVRVA